MEVQLPFLIHDVSRREGPLSLLLQLSFVGFSVCGSCGAPPQRNAERNDGSSLQLLQPDEVRSSFSDEALIDRSLLLGRHETSD